MTSGSAGVLNKKLSPRLQAIAITPAERRSLFLKGSFNFRRDSHDEDTGRYYERKTVRYHWSDSRLGRID